MKRTLPPKVKAAFALKGITFAAWCRQHDTTTSTCYDIFSGRLTGAKGGKASRLIKELEKLGWSGQAAGGRYNERLVAEPEEGAQED